ncbi:hypothetical protein AB0M46_32665 [Dactylosporangium sp. NPDC051485]|uniref:hypothetical protein n=1 Tax=Dactylosporangium sp. NPDC051485 TaxID=3154846 RepID=UPI0034242BFF
MELHCDTCGQVRTFERPPCPDHSPANRADRACTGCGTVVAIAPVILLMDRRPRVLLRRPSHRAA